MSNPRSLPPRKRASIATTAATLAVAGSLIAGAVLTTPLTGSAAVKTVSVKTTKKATKKTAKKVTTKKVTKPAPAKAAKRAGTMWQPNGRATAAPMPFDPNPPSKDTANPSAPNETAAYQKVQPDNGIFSILIVGTDARPNEKPDKTRADSIHIFTYNPTLKRGALIGFPRDSYVAGPDGNRKINEIMAVNGPDAFLNAVNGVSGLKTKRWILTGFQGFTKMVDAIGGIPVKVDTAMNDVYSGAQFAPGWFQFNGNAALAYSRARKTLPNGDFERSANQAKLLIYGLGRLRESTDNINALLNWVKIARKYTVANVAPNEWMYLAQIARFVDPAAVKSVVLTGTSEMVDGSDVVRLDETKMKETFADAADGVLGN